VKVIPGWPVEHIDTLVLGPVRRRAYLAKASETTTIHIVTNAATIDEVLMDENLSANAHSHQLLEAAELAQRTLHPLVEDTVVPATGLLLVVVVEEMTTSRRL